MEGTIPVTLDPDFIDSSDVFSNPIYFRDGFPVGTRTETVAHVSYGVE